MSQLPSAEVAEDFRDALEHLKTNSRPEISNLTIIAKESTEHAQAISRELEMHIKTVRPQWKLPALYVLDSIAKNVGTPYTVYLGRNLYRTFMDAYTTVDEPVRRAMEGLLKTWKLPVPESLDTRPVFNPDITREIENTLVKIRGITQPPRYNQLPPRPIQNGQWNGPGTPSQSGLPFQHPPPHHSGTPLHGAPSVPPGPGYPIPAHLNAGTPHQYLQTPVRYQSPAVGGPPSNGQSQDRLKRDLGQLIVTATIEAATKPGDSRPKTFLTTLLSLQKLVEAAPLSERQIQDIQSELNRISQTFQQPPAAQPTPPPAMPPFFPPTPLQMQQSTPQPQPQAMKDLSALFSSMKPTPPPPAPLPAQSAPDLASIFASIQPTPTPASAGMNGGQPNGTANGAPEEIHLNLASLKMPRPQVVSRLYLARPDQCRECGRRFSATAAGKQAKTRHLDWHFATATRVSEGKQFINRSWYLDELDWVDYTLDDNAAEPRPERTALKKVDPKDLWVEMPTEVEKRNATCSICREKFDVIWHAEAEQPVWMNAVNVGGKTYHATCWEEMQGAEKKGLAGIASVLGKRKADEGLEGIKKK
ncbi:hypothetical protein K402DRAFT_324139 [Aulographum hederae CBS 113979]|uniref:CID domain-containing protein n=1 Tax=Aulographum hederae CBS 113979 TaxID=1176131 RepID=A0A6G1HCA1_9PEZI|nr:hypothetical protein K402DRAFT_324139 [Aulographum hederae CBS 113979]